MAIWAYIVVYVPVRDQIYAVFEWDQETNHVFQEGPAEFVFDGDY